MSSPSPDLPTSTLGSSRADRRSQGTTSPGVAPSSTTKPADHISPAPVLANLPHSNKSSPISPKTVAFESQSNKSSPISPKTVVFESNSPKLDRRKASSPAAVSTARSSLQRKSSSKPAYRRIRSGGVSKPSLAAEAEGISTTIALETIAPGVADRDGWMASRHRSSESLQSGKMSSRSSRLSLGAKARQLFTVPNLRISGNATKDGAPPPDARK